MLATPSCPSSPIFRATPTTPTRTRTKSWKKRRVTEGSFLKRQSLKAFSRRRLSVFLLDDSEGSEQDDRLGETRESRSEFTTPPPRTNARSSLRESPTPPQISPYTPRRSPLQALPSTNLSTRSAPGRLEPRSVKYSPRRAKIPISSSKNVDDRVVKVLKKGLTATEMKEKGVGNIYLFSVVLVSDLGRTIRKIGSTNQAELDRMNDILSECKHSSIHQEVGPQGAPISLFRKAEKLAHAHLDDRKYDFACVCGTSHREYFDVDTAEAQRVIQCWRTFCESEPYDANGKLRPFWQHRLNQRHKLRYWDGQGTEGMSELESRRLRWEVFANPTQFEIRWFKATGIGSKVWPFRLHIIAAIDTLIIAIIISSPQSSFFIAWVFIHAICMSWERSVLLLSGDT
ncbi:hypothetical protein F5Y03DRAFT_345683 [Xylaria venustula]|nr:hypothetical protein F5Y03DRAFT_345683 [Xylaria venustula]